MPFGRELDIHGSRGKPLAERITGTLPDAVDLLGGGTQDAAECVVAEKELILEWAEFTARLIQTEARDRAAHFNVRKAHSGGNQLLDALLLDANAIHELLEHRVRLHRTASRKDRKIEAVV